MTRSRNKRSIRRGGRGWGSRIGIVGIDITNFKLFMNPDRLGIILTKFNGKDYVRFLGVGAAIAVKLTLRIVRMMLSFILVLSN